MGKLHLESVLCCFWVSQMDHLQKPSVVFAGFGFMFSMVELRYIFWIPWAKQVKLSYLVLLIIFLAQIDEKNNHYLHKSKRNICSPLKQRSSDIAPFFKNQRSNWDAILTCWVWKWAIRKSQEVEETNPHERKENPIKKFFQFLQKEFKKALKMKYTTRAEHFYDIIP